MVARRLRTTDAVVRWFQALPQVDDDGHEHVRFIECDVPQRVRLLPDDPNCVERSMGALMLLEAVDPRTPRALATIDRPLRHTGLVEKHGGRWRAVDLFPRRNATNKSAEVGKDILQGIHKYVGKPLLGAYGLGGVADTIGEYEDKAIGRHPSQKQQPQPKAPEKKQQPPQQQAQRPQQPSRPVGTTAGNAEGVKSAQPQRPKIALRPLAVVAALGGAGAQPSKPAIEGGKKDAEEKKQSESGPGAPVRPVAPVVGDEAPADQGDGGDSHDEGEEEERGPWWGVG
jgi:hypothetical protein